MKYTIMLLAVVLSVGACTVQEVQPPVVEEAEETQEKVQEEIGFHNIMSVPISEMRLVTVTTRSKAYNWLVYVGHIPQFLETIEMFHSLDEITEVVSQLPRRHGNPMWDVPVLTKGWQIDTLWVDPGD